MMYVIIHGVFCVTWCMLCYMVYAMLYGVYYVTWCMLCYMMYVMLHSDLCDKSNLSIGFIDSLISSSNLSIVVIADNDNR